MPIDINNGLDYMMIIAGEIEENLDDMFTGDYPFSELEYSIERYNEEREKVRSWFGEHRKEILAAGNEDLYRLVVGYDYSDFLIDVEYRLLPAFHADEYLINNNGKFASKEKLRASVEQYRNLGAYTLYGMMGSKPLEIDAKGAFWTDVDASALGGEKWSTEKIAMEAREQGYTSLVIRNVMDPAMNNYSPNRRADEYIFFSPETVKSADTVTYDDNGNIIPLSERFNEKDSDIRFSARFPELTNIDTFPQYDESGGSSASSLALIWARQPDVKAGDWKLAYYRGRWYIIEKIDSMPDKYQVTKRLKKSMYETYRKMWEEQYGQSDEKEMARIADEIRDFSRAAGKNGERRSDIDDDVLKHSGKTAKVRGLDQRSFRGGTSGFDTDEGAFRSDEDRQGDGTSAGRGVPEVKLSNRDRASMTEERIDWLIRDNGAGKRTDYARGWITSISPTDFINLTTKEFTDRNKFDRMKNDYGTTMADYDYMRELKENQRETPYLAVDMNNGEVVGHEGRHRMRALEQAGVTSVPIKIEFRDENGYVAKEMNGYGNPLTTIAEQALTNQYGNGYTASVENVMPLMQAMRDEIVAAYGQEDSAIRFSDRDQDATDPRTLLSNALLTAAQSDLERQKLADYQAKIKAMNEEQNKLTELRRQIREISFGKGKRDKEKLRADPGHRKKIRKKRPVQAGLFHRSQVQVSMYNSFDALLCFYGCFIHFLVLFGKV